MTATNNIHDDDTGSDQRLKDLFGNDTPFRVPDGYFEELPARVLDSCQKSDRESIRPLYMKAIFRNIAAAAAILITAALIVTMVFTNRQDETDSFTDYTLKDVYEYNFNNLADLEISYLLSILGDEVDENMFTISVDANDVTDDEIIEYLLVENHIDYIINDY